MAAFPIVRLASLAQPARGSMAGGPFGSDLVSSDYVSSGVPVVRGTNLPKDSKFSLDNCVFVTESKADALHLNCAHPGDLVFTQRGTLGQVGLIPNDTPYSRFLISQSQMKMIVDRSKADPLYIYHYFRLPSTVTYIENHALRAGVPHINLGILRRFEIIYPPLKTQQKIAAILSAYDDLIANNQRRITLLERMAEDIYREWFVRLRFPGHEFAVREKGIPQGWRIRNLGDVMELCYGKALKDEVRVPGIFPVYGSAGVVGTHNAGLVDGPGIVVGRKGNVGSVFWSDHAFFPIDTAYFVRSDTSLHYLFFLLQSMNFINNDSAVPGLNRQQAYSNKLLFPPDELIKQFSVKAKSIFKLKQVLLAEVELLKATRDALLPRLISGKLAVDALDIRFPPGMSPLD